jgi:alpha-beta hydrolase superfamily lysophospholipase
VRQSLIASGNGGEHAVKPHSPGSGVTTLSAATSIGRRCSTAFAVLVVCCLGLGGSGQLQARRTLVIRGHEQSVYVYGPSRGDPVIVSSGDGGWIHLGPHVAEFLSARGFYVVGFDVKAYLESFTSRRTTLRPEEEPGDYEVLAEFVRQATGKKPVLIGVSEGAGLSVLAATDARTKAAIAGVIGLGLPDLNELGWRWRDAVIYLTHRVPDEPTFSAAAIVDRVAPLPLAAIHSTHDEFVPMNDVQRILNAARDPKRLWIVNAANHRFSDNLDEFDRILLEALAWVKDKSPR